MRWFMWIIVIVLVIVALNHYFPNITQPTYERGVDYLSSVNEGYISNEKPVPNSQIREFCNTNSSVCWLCNMDTSECRDTP